MNEETTTAPRKMPRSPGRPKLPQGEQRSLITNCLIASRTSARHEAWAKLAGGVGRMHDQLADFGAQHGFVPNQDKSFFEL